MLKYQTGGGSQSSKSDRRREICEQKRLISVDGEDTKLCASFCFRSIETIITEVGTIDHFKTYIMMSERQILS